MRNRINLSHWKTFPWRTTAIVLRERFREDRLGLSAGSLTFTTLMALVPLLTVALAILTAFPMFAKMQTLIQHWLADSLMPESIAHNVVSNITQFSNKARRLGSFGFVALIFSAVALLWTIDTTFNNIWRVKRKRSISRRILMYWGVLTLGPLFLGLSLTLTSYAISVSKGMVQDIFGGTSLLLHIAQFTLLSLGMTALFRYVPNTHVRFSHAFFGGIFVAMGTEIAKWFLAIYLREVVSYNKVYGTFASVPVLLLWLYILWVLVLLGAVIAAYLPSLQRGGIQRRNDTVGVQFEWAIEVLRHLHHAKNMPEKGLTLSDLAARLRVADVQLEPVIEGLQNMDWIALLAEEDAIAPRLVLLVDPAHTLLAPLMEEMLLLRNQNTVLWWEQAYQKNVKLLSVL